jgi:hypothetical protein
LAFAQTGLMTTSMFGEQAYQSVEYEKEMPLLVFVTLANRNVTAKLLIRAN